MNFFIFLHLIETYFANYSPKINLILYSSSDRNSSVTRYLKQQEELQKKFKNEKKTHVKQSHQKHVIRSPKKRRKKIKLGTETVEECYSKSGPLLSEKMTVDFEEASGSEYCPSDEDNYSSEGIMLHV